MCSVIHQVRVYSLASDVASRKCFVASLIFDYVRDQTDPEPSTGLRSHVEYAAETYHRIEITDGTYTAETHLGPDDIMFIDTSRRYRAASDDASDEANAVKRALTERLVADGIMTASTSAGSAPSTLAALWRSFIHEHFGVPMDARPTNIMLLAD